MARRIKPNDRGERARINPKALRLRNMLETLAQDEGCCTYLECIVGVEHHPGSVQDWSSSDQGFAVLRVAEVPNRSHPGIVEPVFFMPDMLPAETALLARQLGCTPDKEGSWVRPTRRRRSSDKSQTTLHVLTATQEHHNYRAVFSCREVLGGEFHAEVLAACDEVVRLRQRGGGRQQPEPRGPLVCTGVQRYDLCAFRQQFPATALPVSLALGQLLTRFTLVDPGSATPVCVYQLGPSPLLNRLTPPEEDAGSNVTVKLQVLQQGLPGDPWLVCGVEPAQG